VKREIPWTIVFVIFSIWVIILGWPVWRWESGAHTALDNAQNSEAMTFNTMSMDTDILTKEKSVDVRLHRLPNAMAERLAELRLLDSIFNTYHVVQTERAIKGDGTVHLTWIAPQNATLQTLYALDTLPIPILVNTAQLTGTQHGIATDLTGRTVAAPTTPPVAAAPAPAPTPTPGGST
jgi:hypothetical protein